VDLSLERLDGGAPVALASLRGRIVVLSLFASWCEPCADQAPAIGALAREYASDGDVTVLGIAKSDPAAEARGFLARHGLTFTVLRTSEDVFDVVGLPTTIVLDREGRVIWRHGGAIADADTVRRQVEALR
jgi:cytochrome c biogenesis protein CcmG/thiol:disulfide interchange protein DsbE